MILDRFRVDDRVAVVTGAGRGIGAAAAVALAQAGADVVISARSEDQLAKVAREVEAAGRRAVAVPADLSDIDVAAGLAAAAFEAFGRLDIVVNNVGGAMPRPFLATKPRHLADAFSFNVAVAHSLTRAAVPYLLDSPTPAAPWSASPRPWGGSRAGATSPTAPPRRRWPTTPGWPPPTWPPGSGSTRSRSARRPPRRSTSCSPTTRCAARWSGRPSSAGSATRRTSRPRSCSWPRAAGYVTGKVLEVDGGMDRPNLDLGLPDL